MTGDSRKPRCKLSRVLDRGQRLERKQKGVLSNVLCVLASDDRLSRAHYRRAVTRRKLVKRFQVAQYRRYYENFIWRLCAYLRHPLPTITAFISIETRKQGKVRGCSPDDSETVETVATGDDSPTQN